MSERTERLYVQVSHISDRWEWRSPIGLVVIRDWRDGAFLIEFGGETVGRLKSGMFIEARRMAESIIASRCRETLKLLGEE